MYRTVFWTLWERARVRWFGRMALKHVNYHIETNRQSRFNAWYRVLGAGALGWPRGMGWGGRWEGGSGWGTHVHPWQIHADVWENQYNISVNNKFFKKRINTKKKKRICLQCGRPGFDPWVGKIPWKRERLPHSSILPWRIPWTI